MTEKLASILKGVTFALLYIGVFLGLQMVLGVEVGILGGDPQNYVGVVTVIAALVSMCIYKIIFYLKDDSLQNRLRIKKPVLMDVVLSFSLAIGFRMLTSAYIKLGENVEALSESMEKAEQSFNPNTMTIFCLFMLLISMYIQAPIFEEILFRGLVQKELEKAMPLWIVFLAQGLLFGIAHMRLIQFWFATVFGVILGILYYKTKNLTVTMLTHGFFNLSAVFEIKDEEAWWQMIGTGLLLTVISIMIFFYVYRKKPTPVEGEVLGGIYDE